MGTILSHMKKSTNVGFQKLQRTMPNHQMDFRNSHTLQPAMFFKNESMFAAMLCYVYDQPTVSRFEKLHQKDLLRNSCNVVKLKNNAMFMTFGYIWANIGPLIIHDFCWGIAWDSIFFMATWPPSPPGSPSRPIALPGKAPRVAI